MAVDTLILATLGSLFACLLSILLVMYVTSKLRALCRVKSSSTAMSSERNIESRRQAPELSPPPTYDQIFSSEIFVIHVDEKFDYSSLCDELPSCLPTYDEAVSLQFQ